MAATWGSQTWGFQNWGTLGDATVTLSSAGSLTSTIASITADAELQVGWGGDTWGENEWGDLSGSQPVAVGSQATFSTGSVSITGDANVVSTLQGTLTLTNAGVTAGIDVTVSASGQELTTSMGEEVIDIGVPITGSQLASNIGSATVDQSLLTGIGWGRRSWGNLAWGGAFSAQAVGQQLTSTINFPATGAFTDVSVSVASPAMTMTFASPSFSITIDQDIFVLASEDQIDASAGSISQITADANVSVSGIQATSSVGNSAAGLFLDVPVTGSQATMSIGNFSLVQSTNESPTGVQATISIGNPSEIPAQHVGVSGLQLTSTAGSVTVVGEAKVIPTGIQLTGSVGTVNITPWQEIDLGVSNTWTTVDLAA